MSPPGTNFLQVDNFELFDMSASASSAVRVRNWPRPVFVSFTTALFSISSPVRDHAAVA